MKSHVVALVSLLVVAMITLPPATQAFVPFCSSPSTSWDLTKGSPSKIPYSAFLGNVESILRTPTLPAVYDKVRVSTNVMMSSAGSQPGVPVLAEKERNKLNQGADAWFYGVPRICYHVDQGFLTHLTDLYRERIPPGGAVLDIMSSWVSHLPPDIMYSRVDGQGMNLVELSSNPRLDTKRVWDLNAEPRLPFDDEAYDAVLCAVSVQYLQQPEKVFADVRRVLKPGGVAIFSFSNRMFYDKAISGWINRSDMARTRLVAEYFRAAGGFGTPEIIKRPAQEGAGFFAGFSEMFGMAGRGDPFFAAVAAKEAS